MNSCTAFLIPVPLNNSNSHQFSIIKSTQATCTPSLSSLSKPRMPSASNATTGMLPTPSSTTSNKTNKAFHKKLEITTIDPFNLTDSNLKRRTNENSSLKNPIIIIPGYGAPAKSYETFRQVLTSSLPPDTSITIAPVTYRQWAMTVGGRPMTAVLKVIDTTVQQVLRTTGKKRVTLCAHSAGGWISRVYLGDTPYPSGNSGICWNGRRFVDQLICLGTPHTSGEPVTKTNMQFVNNNYPHAFHDDVEYLNFAGDGVSVLPFHGRLWHFWHPQWISRLSYSLTDPDITDEDHAVGDGIVPLSVTFLRGAVQNVRLKGVWHSGDSKGPWFGDEQVVRYWSRFLK